MHLAIEQPRLAPLPGEPFKAGIWLTTRRPVQPGHEAPDHQQAIKIASAVWGCTTTVTPARAARAVAMMAQCRIRVSRGGMVGAFRELRDPIQAISARVRAAGPGESRLRRTGRATARVSGRAGGASRGGERFRSCGAGGWPRPQW